MDGAVLPAWGLWLGAQLARLSADGAYAPSIGDGSGVADGQGGGGGGGGGGGELSVTVDSPPDGDKSSGCTRASGSGLGTEAVGVAMVAQRS
jgi:hypothetical protein